MSGKKRAKRPTGVVASTRPNPEMELVACCVCVKRPTFTVDAICRWCRPLEKVQGKTEEVER